MAAHSLVASTVLLFAATAALATQPGDATSALDDHCTADGNCPEIRASSMLGKKQTKHDSMADEELPSFPIQRNVYIKSLESEYLSVMRSTQGEPGMLKACDASKKLPGCMWIIEPSLTRDGHYYLKTSDTDQTLHFTHGVAGQSATLYPCLAGDFANCHWSLVPLENPGDYLIKTFGEEHYLIAGYDNGIATVNYCNKKNPAQKCIWQVQQVACYRKRTQVQNEGDTVFTISPMKDIITCEEKCATTANCHSFTTCTPESANGGGCWGKDLKVEAKDPLMVSPGVWCSTYMEAPC